MTLSGSLIILSVIFLCCNNVLSDFLNPRSLRALMNDYHNKSQQFERKSVRNFLEVTTQYGYPSEEHRITTEDGYILRIHRISGSPKSPPAPGKPVVYMQHGLLSTSDVFALGGPGNDIAYTLSDAGYDVWLGNGRGNIYSRSHKTLSPDTDSQFWKFSFHEIAIYDVSASIDHILNQTDQTSLVYIGHSMGTTVSLVLLSTKPEYNGKIHLVINLATVANWIKPRNLMKFFKYYGSYLKSFLIDEGIEEVLPRTTRVFHFFYSMCRNGSAVHEICQKGLRYLTGCDSRVMNIKMFYEVMMHNPAGCSRQTLFHFHQNIVAGKLQMYDYGRKENIVRYGQISPPPYNLKNIQTPLVLIYGKTDTVAPPEDSLDLSRILRNVTVESVPQESFGHLDFIWALNIKSLLHDRILEILTSFSKQ